MKDAGAYSSMSDAARSAIKLARELQRQAEDGYTEIVVRNPETRDEKVVLVTDLTVV